MATISQKNPVLLLKSAFNAIFYHPVILFPFFVLAFIQLLTLEILFFSVRWPLSEFFAPLIRSFESDLLLHYPYNFTLMTKWFQSVQAPFYVLFSSFFLGMAVRLVYYVNSNQEIKLSVIFRETFSRYIHLLIAALLAVALQFWLIRLYGLLEIVLLRFSIGHDQHAALRWFFNSGAPYFHLLFALFVTTIFAFVIPYIVIDKKKVFASLVLNFRHLGGSFWFVFFVLLLPALLYIPILRLQTNNQWVESRPEAWGIFLAVSVFVVLFIDALQFTSITILYLWKKETS